MGVLCYELVVVVVVVVVVNGAERGTAMKGTRLGSLWALNGRF
jgi:Sec-independent protein translocase protein TatA